MRMAMRTQLRHSGLSSANLFVNLPLSVLLPSSAIADATSVRVRPFTSSEGTFRMSQTESEKQPPPPPVAKKVEHKMELFGEARVDNYYWLRDDSRSDPDVLSHLQQENDYTNLLMSGIYLSYR